MKKTVSLLLALALTAALAGCGGPAQSAAPAAPSAPAEGASAAQPTPAPSGDAARPDASSAPEAASQPEETAGAEEDAGPDALVVYFSWSGNTRSVAEEIAAQTGADLFEIVPETPYTDDYDTLLDIAQAEQRDAARPAIAGAAEDFDRYELIYLGYPNWWGDMPMILYTFLEEYDCSGKTIAPFVTSGGSGFSRTLDTIRSLQPDAAVLDGLSLGSAAAADPGGAVAEWLASLGLDGAGGAS